MGLFSLEKLFGITIRESATDGSDFTNPDADYRRLFLGEDGQLHVKDSAGSVADIGGSGGGTPHGTSFPGGPTTYDHYIRDDLGLEFYWDGTRWLSCTLFTVGFVGAVLEQYANSANPVQRGATLGSTNDIFLVNWFQSWYVVTTNNASHYWTITLYEGDTGGVIDSFTTAAGSPSTWTQTVRALNSVFPTTRKSVQLGIGKTSTPGNLIAPAIVTYRIIGV